MAAKVSSGGKPAATREATPRRSAAPSPRLGGALSLPRLAGALLLAGIVGWIYVPGLRAPLVYDDFNSVVGNASLRRLWPPLGEGNAPGPLAPPPQNCTAGRPLVNLSLAVNYHFGALDPPVYHVTAIALHIAAALLVWGLVRRTLALPYFDKYFGEATTGVADVLGFFSALLWAVHPLPTEAVQYVTQRSELLVGLFYLATIYASSRYLREVGRQRIVWLAAAGMACFAGMASKEVMVSAPLAVLLYDRTFVAGSFRGALSRSPALYALLASSWLLLLVLNAGGPRSDSAGFHLGVPAVVWWCTQAKVLVMYLRLVVWPAPLVIHYAVSYVTTFGAALPYMTFAAVLILATWALLVRHAASGFVLAVMLMVLAPTLVVPITTEVAAERRMYLPLAALMPLLVVGSARLARLAAAKGTAGAARDVTIRRGLAVTAILALAVAVSWTATSARRVRLYNDPIALWQDALRHQPDNAVVRTNLGMTWNARGRPEEALPHLLRATELTPEAAEAWNNLGMAEIAAGDSEGAIVALRRAVQLADDFAAAHNNLGVALGNLGQADESLQHAARAVELAPEYVEARMNLGRQLAQRGDAAGAIEQFQRVVDVRPDFFAAYPPLVELYAAAGRTDVARVLARRARQVALEQGLLDDVERLDAWLRAQPTATPGARP